jgi:hypothetical protein
MDFMRLRNKTHFGYAIPSVFFERFALDLADAIVSFCPDIRLDLAGPIVGVVCNAHPIDSKQAICVGHRRYAGFPSSIWSMIRVAPCRASARGVRFKI